MEILVKKKMNDTSGQKSKTLVVFVSQSGEQNFGKKSTLKLSAAGASNEILAIITDALKEESISGAKKEVSLFRNANVDGHKHLLLVGLGPAKGISLEDVRQASAAAYKKMVLNKLNAADILCDSITKFFKNSDDVIAASTEGFLLSEYDFDDYKSEELRLKRASISEIHFLCGAKTNTLAIKKGIEKGIIVSEAINFSRWLGDTPGNLMNPVNLVKATQNEAKNSKLKITAWDRGKIKKEGFGGLYGVALGSSAEPRFLIMEYKGAAESKKPICFVGKGLTFDSGGISIKPSASMDEMKYDMCGGANVIGTMLAIAKLKLKINAIAYIPASENMPGPLANKPGDILTARNGKTVEVLNTDAEGRLILMDALSYASEKKPAVIFDAATLTGAIIIALHNVHTGVFTSDKSLMSKIQKAADIAGEKVWHLPIDQEHKQDMIGTHADLQNIAAHRGAGSSKAAAFLSEFVDENIPWAHFDIAGTAWNLAERINYCPKKGASGVMIRTFVELARSYQK